MLEYTKTILQKVSFSPYLFKKELRKSKKWLRKEELVVLKSWAILTFGHMYGDVISDVFRSMGV
jgi:hypothetical protein